MAHRGGPWRAGGGGTTPVAMAGREHGQTSGEQTIAGDRMLRRVVCAYVVSVLVAGVIALIWLREGLWWAP